MDQSYTIDEWCRREHISRSMFYKLDRVGDAPKTYSVGRNRRITRAADEAWRAARVAAAEKLAA